MTIPGAIRRLIPAALAAAMLAGCAHHADLTRSSAQDSYGVEMAQMNLWREAMFRFKRAVQIDPGSAMAHNNLAVAYEANGEPELAAKEYREALRLDRSNSYIQKNYSRYTEFVARSRKRGAKPAAPSSRATAGAAAAAPPATRGSEAPDDVPAVPPVPAPAPPPAAPPGGSR